jgi:hypothetical protein
VKVFANDQGRITCGKFPDMFRSFSRGHLPFLLLLVAPGPIPF